MSAAKYILLVFCLSVGFDAAASTSHSNLIAAKTFQYVIESALKSENYIEGNLTKDGYWVENSLGVSSFGIYSDGKKVGIWTFVEDSTFYLKSMASYDFGIKKFELVQHKDSLKFITAEGSHTNSDIFQGKRTIAIRDYMNRDSKSNLRITANDSMQLSKYKKELILQMPDVNNTRLYLTFEACNLGQGLSSKIYLKSVKSFVNGKAQGDHFFYSHYMKDVNNVKYADGKVTGKLMLYSFEEFERFCVVKKGELLGIYDIDLLSENGDVSLVSKKVQKRSLVRIESLFSNDFTDCIKEHDNFSSYSKSLYEGYYGFDLSSFGLSHNGKGGFRSTKEKIKREKFDKSFYSW